jgi:NitT/TauT family transport system substrate-binding protein
MKKLHVSAIVALAVLFANAACAAPETAKLKLGYIPIINFLTAYVAKDQGFFDKNGLDVTLIPINQGNTGVAGIVSQSVDISTPTPTTFLQAVDSGVELVIDASTHLYPTPNKVGVLVSSDGNIHEAKDLAGRKVGVNGIGGMQFVLLKGWLAAHGVDPKSVTFVEVAFPQMADALKARQIDAITISEPFYQRVIKAGTGRLLADLQADIPAGTLGTIYVSTADWAKQNPETIKAFRASLEAAADFIRSKPDEARQSLVKHAQMSKELLDLVSIPNVTVESKPEQLAFWIDLMSKEKLISTKMDPNALIAK